MSLITRASIVCPFADCLHTWPVANVEMRGDDMNGVIVLIGDGECPECHRAPHDHSLIAEDFG